MAQKKKRIGPQSVTAGHPEEWFSDISRLPWRLIIFGFAFMLYVNTFSHTYALDDYYVILSNKFVQAGFDGLGAIWTQPHWYAGHGYRPLTASVFAILHEMFGSNPQPGHVLNALLYAVSCLLLLTVLKRIFKSLDPLALYGTVLLFASHPLHTEVVANIKSLDEILCFLGFLGAVYFLVRSLDDNASTPNRRTHIMAGVVCFALSFLSKESVVGYALAFPLVAYFVSGRDVRRSAGRLLPLAVTWAVCVGVYIMVGKPLQTYAADSVLNNSLLAAPHLSGRMATAVLVLGKYLLLLVFPHPLVHDYGYGTIPLVSFFDARVIIILLVYVVSVVYAAILLRRKSPVSFGVLFYVLTLLPVANVLFPIGTAMGERFLFVPSLGFCLIVGYVLSTIYARLGKNSTHWILLVFAFVLPYSTKTLGRNLDWKDNGTLFSKDIQYASSSAIANASLGNMLIITAQSTSDTAQRAGHLRTAVDLLRRSIAIYPKYGYAHGNMGLAYDMLGEKDSALACYRRALEIDSCDGVALLNAGVIYAQIGKLDSAAIHLERVLAIDAANWQARLQLATVEALQKRYQESIDNYTTVLGSQPYNSQALQLRDRVKRMATKDSIGSTR